MKKSVKLLSLLYILSIPSLYSAQSSTRRVVLPSRYSVSYQDGDTLKTWNTKGAFIVRSHLMSKDNKWIYIQAAKSGGYAHGIYKVDVKSISENNDMLVYENICIDRDILSLSTISDDGNYILARTYKESVSCHVTFNCKIDLKSGNISVLNTENKNLFMQAPKLSITEALEIAKQKLKNEKLFNKVYIYRIFLHGSESEFPYYSISYTYTKPHTYIDKEGAEKTESLKASIRVNMDKSIGRPEADSRTRRRVVYSKPQSQLGPTQQNKAVEDNANQSNAKRRVIPN